MGTARHLSPHDELQPANHDPPLRGRLQRPGRQSRDGSLEPAPVRALRPPQQRPQHDAAAV